MTDKQDLLALTHMGETPEKYMKSVTPPVFMNSLHVFDSVKDYFAVDIFNDEYYYGRASNPTVTILEKKLAALEHGERAVVFSAGMAACAAAIGAGMADILTGSANWALATIIIKPILVLFFTNRSKKIINTRNIFAAIIAGIVGTALYMIAEGIMYGSFVSAFVLSLVGLVQPLGSFIVFVVIENDNFI